jgi:hypothetical protein
MPRNSVYFYLDAAERMFYNFMKENYHEKSNRWYDHVFGRLYQ